MTKEEFEKQYCSNSNMTSKEYDKYFEIVECDCGEDICRGWQAKSIELSPHLTEYIRVRKDEYDELKLAKLELLQYKARDTSIEESKELLLGKSLFKLDKIKELCEKLPRFDEDRHQFIHRIGTINEVKEIIESESE